MNKYEEKAQKMHHHLTKHPKDYQTLISFLQAQSDGIAYEQQRQHYLMLKEIANYKKEVDSNGK